MTKPTTQTRECKVHGEIEFKLYENRVYRCPKCLSDRASEWKRVVKRKAVEYMGGKCQHCGYVGHPGVYDFHHKDPSQKDFSPSRRSWAFERIIPELDKCVLLCANCHAEEHERMWLDSLGSNQGHFE